MSLWFLLLSAAMALVDVNSADQATLEALPGIGPSKAQAILSWREQNGMFKSLDDLDKVDGIGPSTLANLRDQVSFGEAGAGAATGKPAAVASAAESSPAAPTSAAPAASAGASGCPVNINKADASGLTTLPGIGASKAAAIVQFRTDHGAFASCAALDDVSGIGPATLAGLSDCCVVK
jgi:competence protein ComEA